MSFKLFASCENSAAQYYTLKCEPIFPGGLPLLAFEVKALKYVVLHGFSYLFECLPSPGGMLSLTASEPFQNIRSTADSKDAFVTTHSSKESKDRPVGFADFGSVRVFRLQFSNGSSIFVCMSC